MTCEPYTEKKTVYLAAPLFTPHQTQVIEEIKAVIIEAGLEPFSPLDESKHIWKGRPPAECGPAERQAVMQMNKNGIECCDLLFAWLGGWEPWREVKKQLHGWSKVTHTPPPFSDETMQKLIPSLPDTGVVWEMGYANSVGIPTLAYLHRGEEKRSFNLMLSETVDATARGLDELREQLAAFAALPSDAEFADAMVATALESEGAGFAG